MAWIPVDQSLPTHRKTLHVMALLKIPRSQVIGHLVILWGWSADNTKTGALPHEPGLIAEASGWTGDASAFTSALVTAGFLDDNQSDYIIHDWPDYVGRLVAKREHDKTAMQEKRRGDVAATSRPRSGIEKSREEKSREEETPSLSPVTPPEPPSPPVTVDVSPPQAGDNIYAREKQDLPPVKVPPLLRLRSKPLKTDMTPKTPHGEFANVLLTAAEYAKLVARYGDQGTRERIENMSSGIEAKGYKYKSHYAALLNWDRMQLAREARNGIKPATAGGTGEPQGHHGESIGASWDSFVKRRSSAAPIAGD